MFILFNLVFFNLLVGGVNLHHSNLLGQPNLNNINFIIKTDFDAPKLSLINQPEKVNPNNSTEVSVHVEEQINLETLTLNYTANNWTTSTLAEMVANQNQIYVGTIPGQQAGTTINYKVFAQDISRNSAEVSGSYRVKNLANITLEVSSTVIYYGENITVTGSVPVGETNITLTYANFNSSRLNSTMLDYARADSKMLNETAKYVASRSVNASSSGVFSDIYCPNRTGTWIVWASWNGSETYFDAFSGYGNFTLQKMNMTITCNATRSVTIGDNATITGSVYPALANLTVSITFASANATVKQTTHTDSNGTYVISWKPELMGMWRGYASIDGNASISAAYSNVTAFIVNDTFLNQYLIFIIGGVAGVAGVTVVFIIRKRREE